MTFEIKILGCNSASFAFGRHHTSQLLNSNQNLFLIDCGEATQVQMLRYGVKANRIHHIFISHLHGDHYLGLMGLIFTYHLQNRTEGLHIYGPRGLDEIITLQLKHSESKLSYELHFHQIEEDGQLLYENADIFIHALAMNHRIACFGFVFQEKLRKPRWFRGILPVGPGEEDFSGILNPAEGDGHGTETSDILLPPREPRKYVYFADTRVFTQKMESAENANLLYHETTFLSDMKERAISTFHSTAEEAARFAADHGVKELLIGHYSSRYYDVHHFLMEARNFFPETKLAMEGQLYEIKPVHSRKQNIPHGESIT